MPNGYLIFIASPKIDSFHIVDSDSDDLDEIGTIRSRQSKKYGKCIYENENYGGRRKETFKERYK